MYLILAPLHSKGRTIKCHDTFGAVRDSRRLDTRFNDFCFIVDSFFFLFFNTPSQDQWQWWGVGAAVAGRLLTSAHAINPAHRIFKEPLSILSRWSTVGQLDTCPTPQRQLFVPFELLGRAKANQRNYPAVQQSLVTRSNHGCACEGTTNNQGLPIKHMPAFWISIGSIYLLLTVHAPIN